MIELIASILLLIPSTAFIGGVLGVGLMFGAISSHIAVIGIQSGDDGGQLFIYAIIVLICSIAITWLHRSQGIALFHKITGRK